MFLSGIFPPHGINPCNFTLFTVSHSSGILSLGDFSPGILIGNILLGNFPFKRKIISELLN